MKLADTYSSKTRIRADGIACRRGGRTVFERVSFDVQAGDFLMLRGRNGAGKSTLLRLLAGLLPATAGTLSFECDDKTDSQIPPEAMLMAGHQNGLKPALTLKDNAQFFHRLMTGQAPTADALMAAAEAFQLGRLMGDPVQYFSSGQRHRAALMRFALVPRPVWLMDEPTVGLDGENRAALAALIGDHVARGGIAIAASHDAIDLPGLTLTMDDFAPSAPVAEAEAWL